MSKALLQFSATFRGDGTNKTFTLDTLKDPYIFTSPTANWNKEFDHKLPITDVVGITTAAPAGPFDPTSAVIEDGSLITFTTSTAPLGPPSDNGGFFTLTGYFQY